MIRLALLFVLLAAAAQAQTNVRGVCRSPASPFTGVCIAEHPGEYTGGDTLYLWNLNAAHFALDKSNHLVSSSASLLTPVCVHLPNLAGALDTYVAPITHAGFLLRVSCITSGTIVTAPEIALAECDSTGASCGDNSASLTCDADGDSATVFGGAETDAVEALDWMQANVTNVPSVTNGVTTFCYTVAVP